MSGKHTIPNTGWGGQECVTGYVGGCVGRDNIRFQFLLLGLISMISWMLRSFFLLAFAHILRFHEQKEQRHQLQEKFDDLKREVLAEGGDPVKMELPDIVITTNLMFNAPPGTSESERAKPLPRRLVSECLPHVILRVIYLIISEIERGALESTVERNIRESICRGTAMQSSARYPCSHHFYSNV